MIHKIDRWITSTSYGFNVIGATAILAMMLLTCTDVVLRMFRMPIPGTYETIGLLGALFVSFSLAQTSLQKGHIAVDFLIQKLPLNIQFVVYCINELVSAALFSLITWQMFEYANNLRVSGVVSMTLQIPIFPILYGIAVGCGLLSVLLIFSFIKSILGVKPEA